MQDGRKAVWSIPYVSVIFFPSLKQNIIAYHSSNVFSRPDCIFDIHQLRQSGFSGVYSNGFCRCSFEPEIIEIGQSSHKMYSKNILNFPVSSTILNACTKKKYENLLDIPRIYIYIYIYMCVCVYICSRGWLSGTLFNIYLASSLAYKPAHLSSEKSVRQWSVPGRIIPKTLKMVLDTSLLNPQQNKVRIKGKVKQSGEVVAPPYTSV